MVFVIDTNVLVVANNKAEQASPKCVANCAKRLLEISKTGKLAIDDKWRIIKEYQSNCNLGQPGVGNSFLKWVLTYQENLQYCEKVTITPLDSGEKNFKEFPPVDELSAFDPSDRKFVAVALAHPQRPSILQAVDTDWWIHRKALEENGVKIDFLCPRELHNLHAKKEKK